MTYTMLKSKIHRATVTESNINYMGSITIDKALLKASGIYPNEKVLIVNNNNGERFETYVIEGEENSGIICLNGAAARLVQVNDTIIIISFAQMTKEEIDDYKPTVVFVDERNKIVKKGKEMHGKC